MNVVYLGGVWKNTRGTGPVGPHVRTFWKNGGWGVIEEKLSEGNPQKSHVELESSELSQQPGGGQNPLSTPGIGKSVWWLAAEQVEKGKRLCLVLRRGGSKS